VSSQDDGGSRRYLTRHDTVVFEGELRILDAHENVLRNLKTRRVDFFQSGPSGEISLNSSKDEGLHRLMEF